MGLDGYLGAALVSGALALSGLLATVWTSRRRWSGRIVTGLATIAQPTPEPAGLSRQLIQAGLSGAGGARKFFAAKAGLAIGGTVLFLLVTALMVHPPGARLPIALWICGGGFFLPNYWLRARIQSRQLELARGLPDALDLIVTCIEAGLGLDSALQRVSREIALSSPRLAEQLAMVFLEVQAGIPRIEALRRLHERTGLEELKVLAAVLAQAELFGTSIALSLREQSSALRGRRIFQAEERAAMASVKMTIPLILFVLPSLLAIVLGPAGVRIYERLLVHH